MKHRTRALAGLAASLLSSGAFAAMTTLTGSNVSFTFDSALVGLYGMPTVSGDSLIFTPTNFSALSTNGQGIVTKNGTLNVSIVANSGYQFSTISLTERGDYYLIGSDAAVSVGGQIRVFDQDDPVNNEVNSNIVATAPFNAYTTIPTFSTTNWTANASVAVPASGWGGSDGIVSGINLTIENLLIASTAAAGSAAYIEKKFAGTTIVISAVPEAETWTLLLAGLGLVGLAVRRARRSAA